MSLSVMSTANHTNESATSVVTPHESQLAHAPSFVRRPILGSQDPESKAKSKAKVIERLQSAASSKGMSVEEYRVWFLEESRRNTAELPMRLEIMRRDEERMREMVPRVATVLLEEFGLDSLEENWDPKEYGVYLHGYFKLLFKGRLHFHFRPIPFHILRHLHCVDLIPLRCFVRC